MSDEDLNVAVVGALGLVGTEMIRTLERRNFLNNQNRGRTRSPESTERQ